MQEYHFLSFLFSSLSLTFTALPIFLFRRFAVSG